MTTREQQISQYLDNEDIVGTERETYRDALSQALAQYDSIAEMVGELLKARGDYEGAAYDASKNAARQSAVEDAERAIHEDALSVEVRSAWYSIGQTADKSPAEFKILLCTGGPAVQIIGELDGFQEPENPRLEFQGWFIPWTRVPEYMLPDGWEDVLSEYCRAFYFGS